jgi:hypothetical protein
MRSATAAQGSRRRARSSTHSLRPFCQRRRRRAARGALSSSHAIAVTRPGPAGNSRRSRNAAGRDRRGRAPRGRSRGSARRRRRARRRPARSHRPRRAAAPACRSRVCDVDRGGRRDQPACRGRQLRGAVALRQIEGRQQILDGGIIAAGAPSTRGASGRGRGADGDGECSSENAPPLRVIVMRSTACRSNGGKQAAARTRFVAAAVRPRSSTMMTRHRDRDDRQHDEAARLHRRRRAQVTPPATRPAAAARRRTARTPSSPAPRSGRAPCAPPAWADADPRIAIGQPGDHRRDEVGVVVAQHQAREAVRS